MVFVSPHAVVITVAVVSAIVVAAVASSSGSSGSHSYSHYYDGYYSPLSFYVYVPVSMVYTTCAHLWIYVQSGFRTSTLPLRPFHREYETRGKIAIVTGSNTGIGFETARSLSVEYGMTVILACRSQEKGSAAANKITQEGGAALYQHLDLSSFRSVRDFATEIKALYPHGIHVLVNNAGRNTSGESTTEQGYDLLYQTNFLGHFLLTSELMSTFAAPIPSASSVSSSSFLPRIVNLSSVMHHFIGGDYDVEDENFWKAVAMYDQYPESVYAASKLAAILFTVELNRRYPNQIRSIAVNPGAVNSDIWRGFPTFLKPIFSFVFLNSQQGATTSVVASVAKMHSKTLYLQPYQLGGENEQQLPFPPLEIMGPYIGHAACAPRLPKDKNKAAQALWTASEELTRVSTVSAAPVEMGTEEEEEEEQNQTYEPQQEL